MTKLGDLVEDGKAIVTAIYPAGSGYGLGLTQCLAILTPIPQGMTAADYGDKFDGAWLRLIESPKPQHLRTWSDPSEPARVVSFVAGDLSRLNGVWYEWDGMNWSPTAEPKDAPVIECEVK